MAKKLEAPKLTPQERAAKCTEEIRVVLARYNCAVIPQLHADWRIHRWMFSWLARGRLDVIVVAQPDPTSS